MTNEIKERNQSIYLEWKIGGVSEFALSVKYNVKESLVRKIIAGKYDHNKKRI